VRFESNCPVCKHVSTMPPWSPFEINANDASLRAAAEANGGAGKFVAMEKRVGCYCYEDQNFFGDESGIKCCWCVELAMEKHGVPDEVEPGVCHFECNICRCACQAMFDKSKRCQISNGIKKKMEKSKPVELH
jgi:hypothetical protein